jgi:cyanate permease
MMDLANRWVVLGLLFLVGLTAPIQFQSVAALAPFLTAEAGLTYTDIGVLTGLFMLPGVVLAAPMGPFSAWLGDRLALVLGIGVMVVAAIAFAMSDSYWVMVATRLLGGAGGVAVSVLLPKVVADWFAGREIATAMSIIASSVGFGIGLTTALLPMIASQASWQVAILAASGLNVLAILLLLLVYRDGTASAGAATGGERLLWRISRPEAVLSSLAGVARGLFSAGYAIFMSFLPPLLIVRGMDPVQAGLMTSIAALVALVSVPLGGYLTDKTGKPNHFIVGGSLTTAATCLLVPYVAPSILWVVLFGALRGGCTGGIMSMPSRVLRPETRNTGFAVVSAAYFVCMSVLPPIAGWALDATGDAAAPMLFGGLLWFMISVNLVVFLVLKRRWVG